MHSKIYEIFRIKFPSLSEEAATYFPNGKGRIRIRLKNGKELIFTYMNDHEWCLESLKHYTKTIVGGK